MADISAFSSHSNRCAPSGHLRPTGQNTPQKKPHIKVGLLDDVGNITTQFTFEGRDAWALDQLIRTGARGCAPIDNPAPRWSHYMHGGAYARTHARYELRSRLKVLESTFGDGESP